MNSTYQIITDKMIEALQAGFIPWRRPWKPADAPRNIRGTFYSGVNKFLLEWARMKGNYSLNIWLTPKQAMELGGDFRGQKTTQVIFWKVGTRTNEDNEEEKTFLLRYYNVLNVEQVKGIELPASLTVETKELDPIEAAESVVANMPNPPKIQNGGDVACYVPALDLVQMPPMNTFESAELYYAVLFHELAHSTGSERRLARFEDQKCARFGSEDYSKEELVAEMTSAFVCGETGIAADFKNSAAYIQSWIQVLKNESTWVVLAAARAEKAADYILNRTPAEEEDNE